MVRDRKMTKLGMMYSGCRERVTQLVLALDSRAAVQTAVPACPQWSVHELVAHVVGSADDVLAGRLDGAPGQAWTAKQVAAWRGRPIADLLAEWEAREPAIVQMIEAGGHRGPLHFRLDDAAISDAVSHEHDIRGAIGQPGARDSDAVAFGVAFYARNRIEAAAQSGVSLRVRVTDGREFGDADAAVTVTGEPFELLRALAGRRSAAQLRKLAWTGDADLVIPAFERAGVVCPPTHSIEE
jgi:uncharacterized protein (TIGR03083 family)